MPAIMSDSVLGAGHPRTQIGNTRAETYEVNETRVECDVNWNNK